MENPCHFQWLIRNPFLPWRNLEATFYHTNPAKQWRVTLQPLDRRVNFCRFSFSLAFDEWLEIKDHRFQIHADTVMVDIKLNGASVAREEIRSYSFNTGNWFTYYFQSFAFFYPQTQPHLLDITVEISLPGRVLRIEPGNLFCTGNDDLRWLSTDLKQLLDNQQYSNMKLMSSDGRSSIPVHSYIIAARWNNFFKLHSFQKEVVDTVKTNISHSLLSDILTYIYSGALAGFHWPDWTDVAYTTELFQVIDRYKLHHFYKVFVKNDLRQLLETSNHVLIESHLFPLDSINDRPINNSSNTWQVNSDPEYVFIFQIRARKDNRGRPWLSYSLQSKSKSRVYVKVNLEVVRKLESNPPQTVSSFHERDCILDPDSSVKSEPVLFLGCPETFGPTSSDETGIKYFIRCYLNVTDGTSVMQVIGADDFTMQNDLEKFSVLSDHMLELITQPIHQDMTIASRVLDPGVPDEYRCKCSIHKGIFASRAPDYREGLPNAPLENDVPDFEISTLSNEALPIVIDYMYTGKLFSIPIPHLDVIEDFAKRTKFYSLQDLVNRIRSR